MRIFNHYKLKSYNVSHGKNLCINGKIDIYGASCIDIGDNVTLNSDIIFNPIGGMSGMIIYSAGDGIKIGNNTGISNSALVSRGSGIFIEDDVMIGGSCKIYDTDFHSLNFTERMRYPDPGVKVGKVVIKRGAFIGAHSIILKGVTIGQYSIIGAGSVVTKDVPDNEIWAGNPAKFIRKIKQGDNINHENNA